MNAVLGFDFGMKHIGVAVGQRLTKSARPLTEIKAKDGIPDFDEIEGLIEEWGAKVLVVGIPLNMDGTEQHGTHAAQKFANRLRARFEKKFKLKVVEVDERLSTWEASERMKEGMKEKREQGQKGNSKASIHAMAAVVLIEEWFNRD